MNVLVLSNTPWDDSNSFGNSFSNIFSGIPDIKFANIFCRYGQTNNPFDMRFFQITEKSLIINLKDKNEPSGIQVFPGKRSAEELGKTAQNGFDYARKQRWQIFFWIRDAIWKMGRWESIQLRDFIADFKPDIIFQPVYRLGYINDIALFIKQYSNCPMIGYISDDNYTLRQFNFSPLYWIDRLIKRRKVKKVIDQCELLYVISDIQKEEYEKIFVPECKVLTKCADFSAPAPSWGCRNDCVSLLYAGNIGDGRWKSLALISNAVKRLRGEGHQIELNIYTPTPQTKAMKKAFSTDGTILNGPVSPRKVKELQTEADVLVHVEGLSLRNRMTVHQSFSTKLVDYFAFGKCIFAIGTYDEASIKYLIDNDAAIVARNNEEVYSKLSDLCKNNSVIGQYGLQAYNCGRKNHSKDVMQNMLIDDLMYVTNKPIGNKSPQVKQ